MTLSSNQNAHPVIIIERERSAGPPPPTHSEIAERAHQLWLRQGCPNGSAETNWLEAERELHDAVLSRRAIQIANEKGGSVQS